MEKVMIILFLHSVRVRSSAFFLFLETGISEKKVNQGMFFLSGERKTVPLFFIKSLVTLQAMSGLYFINEK